MAYGNYGLVVDSKFKARSFDDLIKPLAMYTLEYNTLEQNINDLSTKANVWENLANELTDKETYDMYKAYSDDLKAAADLLASLGLSKMSRPTLMNLKTRYSKEIVPIELAYATRQKLAELQQLALLQDPTLMFSRRASTTKLSDYIKNPQLAYDTYSGKMLTALAATAASALAKEIIQQPRKWRSILGNSYYETMMQKGFSSRDVLNAILRHPEANKELIRIMDDVVGSSRIADWNDKEALRRAYEYAGQGLWSGVGETSYQMVLNPNHLNPLQQAQLELINQLKNKNLKMNDPNLTDFYSLSEIAEHNKIKLKLFEDFKKKGYILSGGLLTKKGLQELYKTYSPAGDIIGTTSAGTPIMSASNKKIPSEFRQFLNDLGYVPTNNSRQNLLNINNLMRQVNKGYTNSLLPIGDILFKVSRIPVTAEQSKQLASQIGARAVDVSLEGVGRMTKNGNVHQLSSKAGDKLTSSDIAALMKGDYEVDGNSVRIANIVGVPSTSQAILELTNGKRYILPEGMFSDVARIGMATGYAASMALGATPLQKAFGITYGNTYLSSILNTTTPLSTKYKDSNAVMIYGDEEDDNQ